jgi:enoyl-CoA hydratase
MVSYKTLLLDQDGAVLKIILNRPQVHNAQSRVMLEELESAFAQAVKDESVRVMILAAAGDHFSSGHDMGSPEEIADAEQRKPGSWEERYLLWRKLYLEYPMRWRDLPKPVIAQVHGHCVMGGVILALACDFIICSQDARFACRSVRWGASSEQYLGLPWVIGVPQAKQYYFTGDDIDAQTALRVGLVNEVVPREELDEFTMRLAQRIARQDPFALRLSKQACNNVLDFQGQRKHLMDSFHTFILSVVRPSVEERMQSEESMSIEDRIRRRDEKFED